MKIRKEIRELTPEELLRLRRAMAALQAQNGANSFIDLAGFHGLPRRLCPHGSEIFLPWHRVYITRFENALRAFEPKVTLPYWDWTSPESLASGIAPAHNDPEYRPPDQAAAAANPLFAGPIEDRSRLTVRAGARRLEALASFKASVDIAMESDSYLDFNERIEEPHGSLHVWIGGPTDIMGRPMGDMSSVARAAYDPIFWAHHANVDRQWALWQARHPAVKPPRDVLDLPLTGFDGWKVRDTLNPRSRRLNFTYSGLPSPVRGAGRGVQPGPAPPVRARVIVQVDDIDRSGASFLVDVFIGDAATPEQRAFAGTFGIFGAQGLHDEAAGSAMHGMHEGHSMQHGRGPQDHTMHAAPGHALRTRQHIDVTGPVQRLGLQGKTLKVELVATTPEGEQLPASRLPVGNVSVRTVG